MADNDFIQMAKDWIVEDIIIQYTLNPTAYPFITEALESTSL